MQNTNPDNMNVEEQKQQQFDDDEGKIYCKKTFNKKLMKEEEIENEGKLKMCAFFAYGMTCPSMEIYNGC